MAKDYTRGLKEPKSNRSVDLMKSLTEGGELQTFLRIVQDPKEDLTLQIRNNYINVYYMGGNVAKIKSPRSIDVDENYFRTKKKQCNDTEDVKRAKAKRLKVINLFKDGKFREYLNEVRFAMSHYWDIEPKGVEEKKSQHEMSILNKFGKSDYTIIDLEYEVSKESNFKYCGKRRTVTNSIPTPRFDIIAVRNKDARLCVIELKKGVKALGGKSGLQEHAESYAMTIGASGKRWKSFVSEMSNIIQQKQQLGLLDKKVIINSTLEPQFLIAYQYDSHDKKHNESDQQNLVKYYQRTPLKTLDRNYAENIKVIWLKDGDFKLVEK